AARAHIQQETAEDPVALYRQVNVSMTKHLAKAAINAGVKRFIFISSAGVHGRESKKPFTEQDPPAPDTDYTRSKLEAEQILFALAKGTNMQVTILRLPLVYGAEVKGNFLSMLHILEKNIPLPLGSINNKRSLLYIDNLLDFIVRCLDHPAVENEIFLLADEAAISTPDLLRLLRDQLHSKTWIFSLPIWVLKVMAFVVHRQEPLNKLMASFEVDGSKARRLLDWHPPVSMRSGIAATTAAFRKKIEEGPLD
ncbi:MAG TPA: NAD-dependent epimerase/dehydratase family protein, partial [Cellvibrionaceae bacterium]